MTESTASPDAAFDVTQMALGQVIQGSSPIVSLDFHEAGELIVTASADSSITLISALEGRVRKTVHCEKHGVGLVRFTHHDQVSTLGEDCLSNACRLCIYRESLQCNSLQRVLLC